MLPRYVKHELGGSDVAVGIVTGAFAVTGLACRPLAGHIADVRGRRPAVILGALLSALAGLLYFVPAGVPGLIVARLFLGAGEGMVFTAGSAWVVDLAPPDRRGRLIGLYGLAIWSGLSLGPPIGELLLHASSFELVWAFAAGAPLLGAAIALRIPDRFAPLAGERARALIARESLRPGAILSLGVVGFAAISAFLVLLLDERGIGDGALTFVAFAATVVLVRLLGGDLPDRLGPVPCAVGAALVEAAGLALIAVAGSPGGGDHRGDGDGRRLLDALPVAGADRRRAGPGRAPRRRARDVHSLFRSRSRARLDHGRSRSVARRLRGRVLGRRRLRADRGTGGGDRLAPSGAGARGRARLSRDQSQPAPAQSRSWLSRASSFDRTGAQPGSAATLCSS